MAFKVLRMSMSVSFTLPSHCRAPPVPSDLPPHNSIYESMEYSSFQSLPCKSHWPPHSFPTISQRLLCYVPLPGILSPHLSTVFFSHSFLVYLNITFSVRPAKCASLKIELPLAYPSSSPCLFFSEILTTFSHTLYNLLITFIMSPVYWKCELEDRRSCLLLFLLLYPSHLEEG